MLGLPSQTGGRPFLVFLIGTVGQKNPFISRNGEAGI
jgi:hypothetical protein